jgi:Xaa-Pro aminopeptidase
MSAVVQEFRPGMTEADVGTIFICSGYQAGAESVTSGHIMCGSAKEGMVDTKHSFDGVTIHKEDYLSVDMAVSYKGYWADMARIINVGPVTPEFRKYSVQLADAFDAIEDEYLKERKEDIKHVVDRMLRNLTGRELKQIEDLEGDVIVVARPLTCGYHSVKSPAGDRFRHRCRR